MTEYVLLVLLSAAVGLLAPGGEGSGMQKASRFLSGIILLIALAEPISAAVTSASTLPDTFFAIVFPDSTGVEELENEADRWVIRYSAQNIEEGVNRMIENRYGFTKGSVRTVVKTDRDVDGNIVLSSLIVYVDAHLSAYAGEIKRYIADILACPCEVIA